MTEPDRWVGHSLLKRTETIEDRHDVTGGVTGPLDESNELHLGSADRQARDQVKDAWIPISWPPIGD